MVGWILRKTTGEIKPEWYELNKFINVAEELGIELKVITPSQVDVLVDRDDRKSVLVDEKEMSLPDFVIPRLGSATNYYALAVIRHLERLGVYSVNSSESIETTKDKLYSMQILAAANLPTPKTLLAKFPVSPKLIKDKIGFPIIIKTLVGSLGSGVYLAEDVNKFNDVVDIIAEVNSNASIICQEFIKENIGVDLRVLVIGGRVIRCMKRIAKEGDFKANFSRGGTVEPYEINEDIERIALASTKALGLDVSGVDLLIDKDGYKICEVNSSPGFTGMEQAYEGLNVAEEIYNFVKFKLGE